MSKKQRRYGAKLTASNFRYFLRGKGEKASATDYVASTQRRAKLREFDSLLKQFKYADALDATLKTDRADVVASMLEELALRSGLHAALAGRTGPSLLVLLQHTCKHVTHPNHSRMMLSVANLLLDMYTHLIGHNDELGVLLAQLRSRVIAEVKLQQELQQLQGSLNLILNSPYVT